MGMLCTPSMGGEIRVLFYFLFLFLQICDLLYLEPFACLGSRTILFSMVFIDGE